MKVNLPGYPEDSPAKINAAYTFGGIKECVKTVQEHFNIPIDYYVLVNMGGMEKAINQVGGVDVKSPLTFDYEGAHFQKGKTYHLNGSSALKFSRMRYDDPQGDYGRQQRQRIVIMALLKKSVSYKTVLNRSFLKSVSNSSQTDLTFDDMLKLAQNYRGTNAKIVQDHAQGRGQNEDGQAFEVVPGCTGLWQATERNNVGFDEMVELDLEYIQDASVMKGLNIILKTVAIIFKPNGSY